MILYNCLCYYTGDIGHVTFCIPNPSIIAFHDAPNKCLNDEQPFGDLW